MTQCKRLKLKCDRRTPCSSCVKRDAVSRCVYSAAAAERMYVESYFLSPLSSALFLYGLIALVIDDPFFCSSMASLSMGLPNSLQSPGSESFLVYLASGPSSLVAALNLTSLLRLDICHVLETSSDLSMRRPTILPLVFLPELPHRTGNSVIYRIMTEILIVERIRIPPVTSRVYTIGCRPSSRQYKPSSLRVCTDLVRKLNTNALYSPLGPQVAAVLS